MQKTEFEKELTKTLPRGACEHALTCKQATQRCKTRPFLTPEETDNLRCSLEKRWIDCYAWKQQLGMVFDKDLGVYILPEWKTELMKRAGKQSTEKKMTCYNKACVFLKGTTCGSNYYNTIQDCAYRYMEAEK